MKTVAVLCILVIALESVVSTTIAAASRPTTPADPCRDINDKSDCRCDHHKYKPKDSALSLIALCKSKCKTLCEESTDTDGDTDTDTDNGDNIYYEDNQCSNSPALKALAAALIMQIPKERLEDPNLVRSVVGILASINEELGQPYTGRDTITSRPVTGADNSTTRRPVTGADNSTTRRLVTGADNSTTRRLVTGADNSTTTRPVDNITTRSQSSVASLPTTARGQP